MILNLLPDSIWAPLSFRGCVHMGADGRLWGVAGSAVLWGPGTCLNAQAVTYCICNMSVYGFPYSSNGSNNVPLVGLPLGLLS